MKKLVLVLLVLSQPASAQMKLVPKKMTGRVDNCAPIGRTEDGKLVYSMKCEAPPKPAAPAVPPQAQVAPASPDGDPTPESETERSGLFGMSYDRRPKQ